MKGLPLIFDIKRASTSDGPGVRTVVFLKGCNLDCFWCHNPEGKSAVRSLAFFAEKCTGCGVCKKVCPSRNGSCTVCGTCVLCCSAEARKSYGHEYSPEELFAIIRADADYYRATGGGVTFSGGECMLYPDFVSEMAKRCRDAGISVAIDTAGCVPFSHFETVLPYTDIFLYDIKCLDSALHKKGTGQGNELILANLDRLIACGTEIIVRTPEIPNFNEGGEVQRVAEYCKERGLPLEILPYHAMGESKREALAVFSRASADPE